MLDQVVANCVVLTGYKGNVRIRKRNGIVVNTLGPASIEPKHWRWFCYDWRGGSFGLPTVLVAIVAHSQLDLTA